MEPNDQLDNEYLNGLELKTYFIQPPKELEPEPSPNLLTQNNNRRKVSILMDRRHTIHSVDGVRNIFYITGCIKISIFHAFWEFELNSVSFGYAQIIIQSYDWLL